MSRNNSQVLIKKMQPQHQRFGLRKLTIGVASVLLGTTIFLGESAVYADSNTNNNSMNVNTTQVQPSSNQVTVSAANQASDQQSAASNALAASVATPAVSDTPTTSAVSSANNSATATANSNVPSASSSAAASQATSQAAADQAKSSAAQHEQQGTNLDLNMFDYQIDSNGDLIITNIEWGNFKIFNQPTTTILPNNEDFIAAGKLAAGHKAYIGHSVLLNLMGNIWSKSITISGLNGGKLSLLPDESYVNAFTPSNVENLDLSNLDVSGVKNLNGILARMLNVKTINISGWDTSSATDMTQMFANDPALTNIIGLNDLNTSKVTSMLGMFDTDYSLTSLDLSNFDTSNVTDMHNMFDSDSGLTSLNVSSFNTSKVTDMSDMFNACTKLTNLDVTNFDTSKVVNFNQMFANMWNLTDIDLSNFNTSSATMMNSMFANDPISVLDLQSFDFSNNPDVRDLVTCDNPTYQLVLVNQTGANLNSHTIGLDVKPIFTIPKKYSAALPEGFDHINHVFTSLDQARTFVNNELDIIARNIEKLNLGADDDNTSTNNTTTTNATALADILTSLVQLPNSGSTTGASNSDQPASITSKRKGQTVVNSWKGSGEYSHRGGSTGIFQNYDPLTWLKQQEEEEKKHEQTVNDTKTVTETIHYVYADGSQAANDFTATVTFKRTGTKNTETNQTTWGNWTTDSNTFAAVFSPTINGYTPDQAQIGTQSVTADSDNLDYTVTYSKNAPVEPETPTYTNVSDSKTIHETIHYVYADGTKAANDATAEITFTRDGITNNTTGETTWLYWTPNNDHFAAVTSPVIDGYTADQTQVAAQTVNPDSTDLTFTVTYTKLAEPAASDQPASSAEPAQSAADQPANSSTTNQSSQAEPATSGQPVQSSAADPATTPSQVVNPSSAASVIPATHHLAGTTPTLAKDQSLLTTKNSVTTTKAKQLPQTGNQKATGLVALGLSSLLLGLGLAGKQRKEY